MKTAFMPRRREGTSEGFQRRRSWPSVPSPTSRRMASFFRRCAVRSYMPVTLWCLQGISDPVPVKTSSHPPSSLSAVVVATSAVVVGGGSVGVPFDAECPLVNGDPAAVASGTLSAVTVGFPADAPTPFPSVLATSSHHHRRTRSPRAWCNPPLRIKLRRDRINAPVPSGPTICIPPPSTSPPAAPPSSSSSRCPAICHPHH